MKSINLTVRFARRFPNPLKIDRDESEGKYPFENQSSQRHIFIVPVESLPVGIPLDPNPRKQIIDKGIWKDIKKHLLNEEGSANTFHLKNKGITIVVSKVVKRSENTYTLFFEQGDGILDGGHTYELITQHQKQIAEHNAENPDEPINQFVKLEVLSGLDRNCLPEIAGGLNTAMQVQKMSLENLKGVFDWIQDELKNEEYFNDIAFKENVADADFDVRDIIVLLDLLNIKSFPNDSNRNIQVTHPVRAYTSKASVLDHYVANIEEYKSLRPILKDILKLFDTIRSDSIRLHNEAGGKAGKLSFVEKRHRGKYVFPFLGSKGQPKQNDVRLVTAAAYPMLAAFRWCVVPKTPNGQVGWSASFDDVLALFEESAVELMSSTQQTSVENGRKANAIGRSPNHWNNLHNIVAKRIKLPNLLTKYK